MARSTAVRVLLSSLPIYSPSRALSIVLICSSRTVDSVLRPLVIIATWVGRAAFVFLPVIAATMVVGLCLKYRRIVAVDEELFLIGQLKDGFPELVRHNAFHYGIAYIRLLGDEDVLAAEFIGGQHIS